MRRWRWLTLLWPGLPQVWFAGAWSGLAIAAGFAAIFNLTLATTLVWTELFGAEIRWGIGATIGLVWLISAALSWRWVATLRLNSPPQAADEDLLIQARDEYLKGNWFEAEEALGRLLDRNLLDVEARLMLAALLGRVGRREEAKTQLDRLSRTDGAEKWELEISRLQTRMSDDGERAESDENEADSPTAAQSGAAVPRAA